MIPEFTASVGAPRVAGIEFPFGRPLGRPGDRAGQREVLRAALQSLTVARTPGTVVQLPFTWPQTPQQARAEPPIPPPIVQLVKRKPWLALRLLAHDIPEPRQFPPT
jgi:D-proline reductase (dithiol) PrdB